jgi:hypothetical protein
VWPGADVCAFVHSANFDFGMINLLRMTKHGDQADLRVGGPLIAVFRKSAF